MTSAAANSPVRIEGRLEEPLRRGLWLVKWVLIFPHLVVLSLLWVAFAVVEFVAFFAILFTGRYPRSLFDFAVGVLRWSWRVAFYAYSALGTDRYPPFSLEEHPEYPATLDIAYPERLSHGLVLVKWLLALPHLVIVSLFLGGSFFAFRGEHWGYAAGGLIGILVLVAGVVVLFSGRYPRPLFDLILGLDRWVMRVVAYVALMTDEYPPFRLDIGGSETGRPAVDTWETGSVATPAPDAPVAPLPSSQRRWSGGRITAVVAGSLVVLCGFGAAAGGGAMLIGSSVLRTDDGMVGTPTERFSTDSAAIRFGTADLSWVDSGWTDSVALGQVQVRSQSTSSDVPLFVGIGSQSDVSRYLRGVDTATVSDIGVFPFSVRYTEQPGSAAATPPGQQDFWVASSSGVGPQTLTWDSAPGRWVLVVMNADGSAGVSADVSLSAELPLLTPIGWALLSAGIVLILIGAVVIVVVAAGASGRGTSPQYPGTPTDRPLVHS